MKALCPFLATVLIVLSCGPDGTAEQPPPSSSGADSRENSENADTQLDEYLGDMKEDPEALANLVRDNIFYLEIAARHDRVPHPATREEKLVRPAILRLDAMEPEKAALALPSLVRLVGLPRRYNISSRVEYPVDNFVLHCGRFSTPHLVKALELPTPFISTTVNGKKVKNVWRSKQKGHFASILIRIEGAKEAEELLLKRIDEAKTPKAIDNLQKALALLRSRQGLPLGADTPQDKYRLELQRVREERGTGLKAEDYNEILQEIRSHEDTRKATIEKTSYILDFYWKKYVHSDRDIKNICEVLSYVGRYRLTELTPVCLKFLFISQNIRWERPLYGGPDLSLTWRSVNDAAASALVEIGTPAVPEILKYFAECNRPIVRIFVRPVIVKIYGEKIGKMVVEEAINAETDAERRGRLEQLLKDFSLYSEAESGPGPREGGDREEDAGLSDTPPDAGDTEPSLISPGREQSEISPTGETPPKGKSPIPPSRPGWLVSNGHWVVISVIALTVIVAVVLLIRKKA